MSIFQLLPQPAVARALRGLYLSHDVRQYAGGERPFIYSNFVSSLDGRVAIENDGGLGVPGPIANDRDWRLFQELAAQADALLVTGPFMRKLAAGEAAPIAQFEREAYADLAAWRAARELPPLPDLVVISRSLGFDVAPEAIARARKIRVVTARQTSQNKKTALQQRGAEVVNGGDEGVTGEGLLAALQEWGYETVYSPAGPQVLHLLAAADILDRLYLTHAPRLLGGDPFLTVASGPLLEPYPFDLTELYHDPEGLDGSGQLFAVYDRRR